MTHFEPQKEDTNYVNESNIRNLWFHYSVIPKYLQNNLICYYIDTNPLLLKKILLLVDNAQVLIANTTDAHIELFALRLLKRRTYIHIK